MIPVAPQADTTVAMSAPMVDVKKNRPKSDGFRQQKLPAFQPIMTPLKVVVIFIVIGIIFIPTGVSLLSSSSQIYEKSIKYDGDSGLDVDCSIDVQNEGKQCQLQFTFDKDVSGPIYVYYELENFYQNHRLYVSSLTYAQLAGQQLSGAALDTCGTTTTNKTENAEYTLNPCGLIANSFFTDYLSCSAHTLDDSDIAWSTDKEKYKNVQGFEVKFYDSLYDASNPITDTCAAAGLNADCEAYYADSGNCLYYYPDNDKYQYLYETYPGYISPCYGVQDQHFMVWMRTAALPTFRKLWGVIDHDFKSGNTLTIDVVANYEVVSFDGGKSVVISTAGEFGGRNPYLGVAYVVVGAISLFLGFVFGMKTLLSPRILGDPTSLHWD